MMWVTPSFMGGDDKVGEKQVGDFLATLTIDSSVKEHVLIIVKHISFRHSLDKKPSRFSSSELSIVQDADRLDAMGAIGIARAFSYGGYSGRPLHDPSYQVKLQQSKRECQTVKSPTIAHFYENLLTLKDKMNTEVYGGVSAKIFVRMEWRIIFKFCPPTELALLLIESV